MVHHRWPSRFRAATAAVITLHTALTAARQTLATVTERAERAERAERQGYYSGARTDIINSHSELRAALDLLIKAAEHEHAAPITRGPGPATG